MAPRHDDDKARDDGKGFLSRWSQRKRAAEEESPEPRDAPQAASGEGAADDDTIDPKDLPDIDSLDANSDYSVFLKKGVPAGLKRKALNKLWQTDPAFRHICMLDDYNLDYTDAAMVVPNLKTLFQVGRGMVLPEEEAAAPESAAQAAAPAADAEESPDPAAAAPESLPAPGGDDAAAPAQAPQKRPQPRMPGTPVVPAAATRGTSGPASGRASAPARGERSARQRRWGDPGEA